MPNVAVVADTSACLPQALIEQYGITLVPLAYLIDGELYHDGQLAAEEFQRRLEEAKAPPTTTVPAPGEFLDVFRRLRADGRDRILCLTLSSRYSGTYSAALNGAELARREMPRLELRVVDTGGLAMTHGFAVLAAARAAADGAGMEEAAAVAASVGGRASLVGALDTMRFLVKSGRVPWIVSWAASLLDIKPVLAAARGEVRSHGRPRTMRNALDRIVRYLRERAGPAERLHVAVMHFGARERAQALLERVREELSPAELMLTEFTPVMSVHTGPGFIGLAFYSDAPDPAPAPRSRPAARDVALLEQEIGPMPEAVAEPVLLVLSGLPGSGKTHLAREVAARYPIAVLESDRLRKALVKTPRYTRAENARLFRACHWLIDDLLARNVSCLLDATTLREEHRRPLYRIAERRGARLVLVSVTAPPEVARERLAARRGEPGTYSDAGVQVYEEMLGEAEPIAAEHLVVDSTADADSSAELVVRALREGDGHRSPSR
jgi:DegV family protein with EDD domain